MVPDPRPGSARRSEGTPRHRFDPERLGPFGRGLTVRETEANEVALDELLDPPRLASVMKDHADGLGDVPLAVVGSSWVNHLATLLLPGIVTGWTVHRMGVDASAGNLALELPAGTPRRVHILDPGNVRVGDPGRDLAVESLFGGTLEPLFEAVEEATGAGTSILWSTAANVVAYVFDRLADHDGSSGTLVEDRAKLLDDDTAAWTDRPNPLQGTITYQDLTPAGGPGSYQVRQVCCLKTEIPGKDPCASCPRVSRERRAELVAGREDGA